MSSKVTYRQQHTRCGKERCRKCKEGAGHGPYWYAFWSENGRTISKYIGVRLPAHIEIERRLQSRNGTPLAVEQDTQTEELIPSNAPIRSKLLAHLPLQLETQVLRIFVLGQFRVERWGDDAWQAVVHRTWHRRRARALLGCLLSHPGRRLGREQAMEALWPEIDREIAANRLNGAVHELRQILEPELERPAASRMLRLERDVLELAGRKHIWVDADAFESLLNEANTLSVQASNATPPYQGPNVAQVEEIELLLEEASALYGGDYLLEELYSEWATPRRQALRRGWIGLLLKLAELREKRGAFTGAMEPLNQLLATDPTDETAVQRLMLLLTQLDRRGEALNTYRYLASRLQRHYESEPMLETQELYEKLRLGHISKKSHAVPLPAQVESDGGVSEEAGARHSLAQQQLQPVTEDKSMPSVTTTIATAKKLRRSNQSPLIGRTQELDSMRQLMLSIERASPDLRVENNSHELSAAELQHSKAKHLCLLLLMGEAGIGKTRLAAELSHEAHSRGWAVAWTRAYEQEGAIPYRPWIELLRSLLTNIPAEVLISSVGPGGKEASTPLHSASTTLERLSTLLPELRDLIPPNARTYRQLSPEQERLHLWEATLELLSVLSKRAPLLLVLDDLHWTDGSSRELLAYLTHHIQDQRILLLGTCRDVELPPDHALRVLIADLRREQAICTLAVQPLTRSQIGELVAHLPGDIVQSIQTQAAGNPFFAEELARASEFTHSSSSSSESQHSGMYSSTIVQSNDRNREAVSSASTLPESIAAVLERRLGKLSIACQLLLGKAAVLGGSFELSQLLYMANEHHEESILDLLEEALRAGLLTEEGAGAHITYHFWHPLIVNHLYKRLSATRYAQLHRRAASALLHVHQGSEGEVE